jgi:hypothetical protein
LALLPLLLFFLRRLLRSTTGWGAAAPRSVHRAAITARNAPDVEG